MAIEFFPENPGLVMSPRISFSHDLSQSDIVPIEQSLFRSNSSPGVDFDFCIRDSCDQESSSADELFSDGKILPTQIKKKVSPKKQSTPPESSRLSLKKSKSEIHEIENEVVLKELKGTNSRIEEKQNTKSFWGFKRSSSLNCGSGYAPSLCPLPLLSRSNSTGSASSAKRSSISKDNHNAQKQNLLKNSAFPSSKSSHLKPPLKKNYGSYGNGVRVNPVLNVPSGNLFGFGSIFSNGKDKNKKK